MTNLKYPHLPLWYKIQCNSSFCQNMQEFINRHVDEHQTIDTCTICKTEWIYFTTLQPGECRFTLQQSSSCYLYRLGTLRRQLLRQVRNATSAQCINTYHVRHRSTPLRVHPPEHKVPTVWKGSETNKWKRTDHKRKVPQNAQAINSPEAESAAFRIHRALAAPCPLFSSRRSERL